MDGTQPTLSNRVSYVIVMLLLGAFCFSVASVAAATADDGGKLVAKRDSGPGHDGDDDSDDDDDDDDDGTDTGTVDTTATGTTKGTGASNTATNDTATGTRTVV